MEPFQANLTRTRRSCEKLRDANSGRSQASDLTAGFPKAMHLQRYPRVLPLRTLLTLAGIYPREPRHKSKVRKGSGHATTFYYAKDIQYLLHEPLLSKFRDQKALAKKVARALGRNEVGDAQRIDRSKPRMTLDHVIKERYPTFVDALRDLDDALTMLFLFASLPSTATVPPKTISLCQRLCLEFQHYVILSRSLRKSFLSIRGIYFQATIQGQDIMWLVPYKFVQKMAGDIDFRIMGTFVEFYTTLLGFVNFRLYSTIGLVYPPNFSKLADDRGSELGAFTITAKDLVKQTNGNGLIHTSTLEGSSSAQMEADKVARLAPDSEEQTRVEDEDQPSNEGIDTFKPVTTVDADILAQPEYTGSESNSLFGKFTFYLSRETPKAALEFILKSFGCTKVGWDATFGDGAFTTDEKDPRITHQIVDRPAVAPADGAEGSNGTQLRVPGRTYVQPQWVWDCMNQGKLLRPDLYSPGASLPPHLSPWMKPKPGMYDPTRTLEEQEREDERDLDAEEDVNPGEDADDGENGIEASQSGSSDEEDESDEEEVKTGEGMTVDIGGSDGEEDASEAGEWDGLSDAGEDLSDQDQQLSQYQQELEAEAAGRPIAVHAVKDKAVEARKKRDLREKREQEELDRQRMMMTNKKRKLFDKMHYGNRRREAEAEKLRQKRRRVERQSKPQN
jgi:pescadillo protein